MSIFTQSKIVLAPNTNNILDYNGCGACGWSGTINAILFSSVTWAGGVGAANSMLPAITTQLAKQRLYNLTRGNYALISNVNIGTATIDLTDVPPSNWAFGDNITTITPNLTGAPGSFVDMEITSGELIGKSSIFVFVFYRDTGAFGNFLSIHPSFGAWGAPKEQTIFNPTAAASFVSSLFLFPLNQSVFSVRWSASGAATARPILRQVGYG